MQYEFEVENSTGITEAIVRGANIPGTGVKRYIVIPEERERLLARKVEEPALKERIKRDNWGFIRYDQFSEFYSRSRGRKKIEPGEIEKIARAPKTRSLRDAKMEEFADAADGQRTLD